MPSLSFDDCVQVTFNPTSGAGAVEPGKNNTAPRVWLFAVDQGDESGFLVFSGESPVEGESETTINLAVFNPITDLLSRGTGSSTYQEADIDWGSTWTDVLDRQGLATEDGFTDRQISDHWHIYAHGYHWISYSIRGKSGGVPQNAEIWLAQISVVIATDGSWAYTVDTHVQLGYVYGYGWQADSASVTLPDTCSTNDHFLVETADGVAVGVFRHGAGGPPATGPGHRILYYSLSVGRRGIYTDFGVWSTAYDHVNLASARSFPPAIDPGVHFISSLVSPDWRRHRLPDHAPEVVLDGELPSPALGTSRLLDAHLIGVEAPDPNLAIADLAALAMDMTKPSHNPSELAGKDNSIIVFRTNETFSEHATRLLPAEIGIGSGAGFPSGLNSKATFVRVRVTDDLYVTVYQGIDTATSDPWPTAPGPGADYDYGELYREVWTDGFASLDAGPTVLTGPAASLTAAGVATTSLPLDPLNCSRPHTLLTQYDGDTWLITTFDTWDGETKTCGMHLTRVSS